MLAGGSTALHASVHGGHYEVAKYLIEQGINVDTCDQYGRTALHYASYYSHYNIVKLLVDSNANLFVQDIYGYTPFNYSLLRVITG